MREILRYDWYGLIVRLMSDGDHWQLVASGEYAGQPVPPPVPLVCCVQLGDGRVRYAMVPPGTEGRVSYGRVDGDDRLSLLVAGGEGWSAWRLVGKRAAGERARELGAGG